MKHEILGEGRFFASPENKLICVKPDCYKIVKKLLKKDYNELSEEQLNDRLKVLVLKFMKSISEIKVSTEKGVYNNILFLWYKDGFCHFKNILGDKIQAYTFSNVEVNSCKEEIYNYPTIETVSYKVFGEYQFEDDFISDKNIEAILKRYS